MANNNKEQINPNKMKQKSEMGSKAGISQKSNTNVFSKLISKSASMLLVAIAGFGLMSFTQDDVVVAHHNDTNLNIAKQTATVNITEDCCAAQLMAKPGDEIKKLLVSMPGAPRTILTADVENSKIFVADAKERMLWSMNLAAAQKNADSEMLLNFQLSKLIPELVLGNNADALMADRFAEVIVAQTTIYATDKVALADAAMSDIFMAEHFAISVVKPAAQASYMADNQMIRVFERANLPFIHMPSQLVAAHADAGMANHYEAAVKMATTIAVK